MKIVVTHPNIKSIIDKDEVQISLQELSNIDSAYCTSIHLADCMDYVPEEERDKLLNLSISKLRIGGIITVSGTDIISLAQQIHCGMIGLKQINSSLFKGRLSVSHITELINILKTKGLKIENARVDNLYYSIKAKR